MHEREVRGKQWQAIAGTYTDTMDWLSNLPRRAVINDFDGPPAKPKKGEDVIQGCVRLEAAAHHARERVKEAENAPLSAESVKNQVRAWVRDFADAGRPDVSSVIGGAGAGSIRFTKERHELVARCANEEQTLVTGSTSAVDPFALCAWLNPDAVADRLCEELDELEPEASAMSAEDKVEATAKAKAELLVIEREWAQHLAEVESRGDLGMRRRGIDPRAILNIVVDGHFKNG